MIRFRGPTAGRTLVGVSKRGVKGEKKMNDRLSLSIFTIEVDGKPVLAFGARRYSEAQAICTDEQLRTKLSSLKSDTVPLCGDNAILRVRLAHPKEAARYRQATSQSTEDLMLVYLVKLDGPEDVPWSTRFDDPIVLAKWPERHPQTGSMSIFTTYL